MPISSEDVYRSVICVSCHLLNLLQSCGQDVVKSWLPVDLKETLKFVASYWELTKKLNPAEIDALERLVVSQRFRFPHLDAFTATNGVKDPLKCVIQILSRNPFLSKENRDCLFEFCLDTGFQVPHFHTPIDDHPSELTTGQWRLVEIRHFIRHLSVLEGSDSINLFLDSCFENDPFYLVWLLFDCLEQLIDPINDLDGSLSTKLIRWLQIASSKDSRCRAALVQQDAVRLRDQIFTNPELENCILSVFDAGTIFDDPYTVAPSDVATFASLLINTLPGGPEIRRRIQFLGSNTSTDYWQSVWNRLIELER